MEDGIKFSGSRLQMKPERKVIEKNRRNQMKFLYNRLYSLVPPNFKSKGGCQQQVSDQVDRTIDYIQTLKNNLETSKIKKEKLLTEKRSQEQTKINNVNVSCCKSPDIQIHQISHDLDAVLVTGLNSYSSFCDFLRLLDRYSAEIGAEDVRKRLENLAEECSNMKELCDASFCNEVDQDLSIWDFDFQPSGWGCELGMIFNTSGYN